MNRKANSPGFPTPKKIYYILANCIGKFNILMGYVKIS